MSKRVHRLATASIIHLSKTHHGTAGNPLAYPPGGPGGPTYSNPLPVYCSTPSSTTGPMVPITNCVNPQLIQPPTAPGPSRPRSPPLRSSPPPPSTAPGSTSRRPAPTTALGRWPPSSS
ncbi:uncharacterized protein CEXT_486051 [Caerostris extrusa]|uniref:Uncharacterized protein n=1 Tax=Caerostris extrusa TaxID=172846 RepID=A0AAV4N349_CAEEX|nr:uncharacterized protein CEXT_486051 [Caerostris extrusa]